MKAKEFLANQQKRLLGKVTGAGSSYSEMFVYLLRLRQACCHMSLLSECLDANELNSYKLESEGLEGLMSNLTLNKTDADRY